jgi:3-hydroxybutyryl-CoA dehydrogenase
MKLIGVIGAGTMGNGIAHVSALNGKKVIISDISKEFLDKGYATIEIN